MLTLANKYETIRLLDKSIEDVTAMNASTARLPTLSTAILLMLITCLLVACGGGSDEQSSSVASQPIENNLPLGEIISGDYFPLETGSRWIFDVTVSDSWASTVRYLSSQVVAGAATVAGQKSQLIRNVNPENGDLISLDYMTKTANAISAYFEGNTPPIDIVHLPLRQGDRFVQVDRKSVDVGVDYDGDGINEKMSLFFEVTVAGFEEVQTPAGIFTQALKVQGQGTATYFYSRNGAQIVVNHTTIDWYVNGVGQVKQIETLIAPNRNFTTTHTLESYKVGSHTNDVTPPSIIQVSPTEGSLQGGLPVVRIQFSENIDVRTFNPANIALRDASGQSIQGDINFVNQVLTFTPKQALASGRFTFYVGDTIGDLLGNALSKPLTLNFNVDAEAPSVVANMPLTSATMVPLDSNITVEFSEELGLGSLNSDSVKLYKDDGGLELVATTLKVEGKKITLTPNSVLERNKKYVVYVYPTVKDFAGNPLPELYSFTFQSHTGLFQQYQYIRTGSTPEAVAIGDVNGDGLNDVVMTTSVHLNDDNDFKLMVFLQQSNGTLAKQVNYNTLSNFNCLPTSVAIADIDSDGKPEIIIGENSCGIEILGRNASGDWVGRGQLTTADGYKIKVADLNNDGKQDIVGVGYATNTTSIWYQSAKGTLNDPIIYPLAHGGREDMKIGDINGDGLQDIIVVGEGYTPPTFGYLLQLPNGGFDVAHYLAFGVSDVTVFNTVGICDVNGDLRNDVIVGTNYSIGIFLQKANGTLANVSILASQLTPNTIECGDMDNNGRSDILVGHLSLFKQSIDGVLEEEPYPSYWGSWTNTNGVAVGDINNDGFKDAVMTEANGNLVVLYNNSVNKANFANRRTMPIQSNLMSSKSNRFYNAKFMMRPLPVFRP
ncbi:MAG: FG-GAP-like repeat-containing protein [Agitococcus sp.]|nr:FG-GAP-like repeat-containing protein [Agitococcus sp.]